jgi:hypothetical protein
MADVPLKLVDYRVLFLEYEERHYEDGVYYRRDLEPGTGVWMRGSDGKIASLWFTCPCGCGAIAAVTVNPAYGKAWAWNGSEDKPTTTPSILRTHGCKWHGWLTDGIFRGT